ncbi:NAD(P)/FAD-dependent oxidoreductase [Streptomyces sp. A5-4]|uniref:NAD(P)/FAD-dependent oxidoreductase n=1 Tax=Streptomyces sp. A5-4 TaxID=3384771 RepID=UPI003DA891C8
MTAKELHKRQIVVLGAGYAGLMAALRLAPHHHVTLVDSNAGFSERVRLHELAAGHRESVAHPFTGLLHGTGIRHVATYATAIDLAAHQVTTADDRHIPYDRLVYALGSHTPTPGGSRAHTAATASSLRKRLLKGPGKLIVVGGGLTGIEMAAELAEAYPRWQVGLVTAGLVGAGLSDRGRAHIRTTLTTLGVHVEEGRRVTSADTIDADAVVWAAAMIANTQLAATAGLAVDDADRVRTDPALRSLSHPEVLAAGDCAAGHRMACATALPTGAHAAATVLAEARGQEPDALRLRLVVQCISLGRQDGLIQFVRPDDSPRVRILTGRSAAWVKERVVRSTVRSLQLAAKHPRLAQYAAGIG